MVVWQLKDTDWCRVGALAAVQVPLLCCLQLCWRATRPAKVDARSGSQSPDKGFALLEWTGALVPQGLLVKGTNSPDPPALSS